MRFSDKNSKKNLVKKRLSSITVMRRVANPFYDGSSSSLVFV